MKPFQFRLGQVLMVRELQTLQAQQALVEARMRLSEASSALEGAREARAGYSAWLEQRRLQGMAVWEWAATSRQHRALSEAEQAAAEAMHQALEVVAARQLDLQQAQREEKVLQTLQEQQLAAYQLQVLAADQAAMDEMARLSPGLGVR